MKGTEAICEGALRNGCRAFFGYPITPQNEIPEYMSEIMPKIGGVFLQAESEVAAINMVYGAAGAGVRAMTSSSSPGVSLKQEGISYIACAKLPCVIVNIMRAGPGLGGILPAQGDYNQSVKGGGHGDYKLIVYAPCSVQESCDLTYKAFDISDKYRVPAVILADGMTGQMMEPVILPPQRDLNTIPKKAWATTGGFGKNRRVVNSLLINPDELEAHNNKMKEVYAQIAKNEVMFEEYKTADAEIILTAYGTVARICKSAVDMLRAKGVKAGFIRPITLFPFPDGAYLRLAKMESVKKFLCVELSSLGQMVNDVRLAVNGLKPVEYFGRSGGNVMDEEEIIRFIMNN